MAIILPLVMSFIEEHWGLGKQALLVNMDSFRQVLDDERMFRSFKQFAAKGKGRFFRCDVYINAMIVTSIAFYILNDGVKS
jgi:hypothetical protein